MAEFVESHSLQTLYTGNHGWLQSWLREQSRRHRSHALMALSFFLGVTHSSYALEAPGAQSSFWSGDIRMLVTGYERTDRVGASSTQTEGRLRARVGASWQWDDRLSVVGRLAASASTAGNHWKLAVFDAAQSSSGLAFGNATLDVAHLLFKPDAHWQVRLGRFQDSLQLPAVPAKSLDRNDSDGVDINYSDGVSAEWRGDSGWRVLGIAQYNPADGPTNRPRAPLSFAASGSRVSAFVALHKSDAQGRWALRSVSLSVLPEGLRDGADTDSYVGTVANLALRWPLSAGAARLVVGGSFGYAPYIPTALMRYRDAHWAGQVTANVFDFAPLRQSIGVVWMRGGAGWLISPDLANNLRLWELRYRIIPLQAWTFDARLRYRSDDQTAPAAAQRQHDVGGFVRATWRY